MLFDFKKHFIYCPKWLLVLFIENLFNVIHYLFVEQISYTFWINNPRVPILIFWQVGFLVMENGIIGWLVAYCYCMLDVSWTASYEITLVRRPVYSSLSFLVFTYIVHDDSWPWYLVTDKTRFLIKLFGSKFGPNKPNSDPKLGFLPFSHILVYYFSFKLHIMIACNNVKHWAKVKLMKKKLGAQN